MNTIPDCERQNAGYQEHALKCAAKNLIGQRITDCYWEPHHEIPEELKGIADNERAFIICLESGKFLYASVDPEQNGSGTMVLCESKGGGKNGPLQMFVPLPNVQKLITSHPLRKKGGQKP